MRHDVSTLLGRLPDRERQVLELRYGITDGRSRTLMEVSREFGLTRERIRQIEAQALNRIRGLQEIESLREYLG
jgi:RNA polymerase primary sigma factor